MYNTFYLRIIKEYAAALIEDLIKVEAIETVDDAVDLTSAQKEALNNELDAIERNPDYILNWNNIKHRYKKPYSLHHSRSISYL